MYRIAFLKISLLILFGMFVSCNRKLETLPYYNTPDFTPVFLGDSREVNERIHHRIDPFILTNQEGETITEKEIAGKIHVANFMFTSCSGICPAMTENLKKAARYFDKNKDILFLSFSVNPAKDSVPVLRDYKRSNGIINPNWHFFTGSTEYIYHLARTSYFAEEELGFTKDSTEFLHTEHVLLVDRSGRIRGIYNGTLKLDIEQLIEDIQKLMDEER